MPSVRLRTAAPRERRQDRPARTERTLAGLAAARARGRIGGHPTVVTAVGSRVGGTHPDPTVSPRRRRRRVRVGAHPHRHRPRPRRNGGPAPTTTVAHHPRRTRRRRRPAPRAAHPPVDRRQNARRSHGDVDRAGPAAGALRGNSHVAPVRRVRHRPGTMAGPAMMTVHRRHAWPSSLFVASR